MNDESLIVRQAIDSDLEILVGLIAQLYEIEKEFKFDADVHRNGLKELLDIPGQACIWVVLAEDKVIGMCTGQKLISTAIGAPVLQIEDVIIDRHHEVPV